MNVSSESRKIHGREKELDKLIVGEPDCSFSKVTDAIMSSSTSAVLHGRWNEIAILLGTPLTKTEAIKSEFKNNFDVHGAILSILQDWRLRESTSATLKKLIQTFRSQHMKDIADNIEGKFKIGYVDEAQKNDMIEHIQYYIIDLIDKTVLTDDLLSKMVKDNMLTSHDLESLQQSEKSSRFGNEYKNRKFYKIILSKLKENGSLYHYIVTIFQKDSRNHQNGVGCILNSYFE